MDKIELVLNRRKAGNYAFFCPSSQLHLTISNPVGYADRITSYILRGLKSGAILDTKGVVDLDAGIVRKTLPVVETVVETIPVPNVVMAAPVELTPSVDTVEVVEPVIESTVEQEPIKEENNEEPVEEVVAKKANKKAAK